MPSIVPGFEYDIFVSYRHKDNKYDGWVTEFIHNLKKELEAISKDEINIYYDENPQDGLLESHHVEGSINNKIKSLILIPVLSQTYCDERSYAWSNEFLTFKRIAEKDPYGTEIKLSNGNVASRILPIRIHELDQVDYELLKKKTGSEIRAIDFVYKTSGVNRPLRERDDDVIKDVNQPLYRDQINKLANAIKEIISSAKAIEPEEQTALETATTESSLKEKKGKSPAQIDFRIKILNQVEIFSKLTRELLEEVASKLKTIYLDADQPVIKKGEKGDSMFIIVDGSVKVHDENHVFSELTGGDCFGEYTLIDNKDRSASVTTLEETSLFKLESQVFHELITRNPKFINAVLVTLVNRLRKLDEVQEKLASSLKVIQKQSKEIGDTNQALENSNQQMQQIMKIVAVDINDPLASSISITESLKKEVEETHPDLMEYFDSLARSLKRMNEIATKLLDMKIHK